MIYVTGDMHGDRARFGLRGWRKIKKDDFLIVCGDFGFLWDGSDEEKKLLEWIGKRSYHVLFVEGTHDNLELLNSYPTEQWQGGLTHAISGKLRHLVRGERFDLDGVTVLAMGGGQPDDGARIGVNCWQGVLPSEGEVVDICDKLDCVDWQADLIISHQPPTNIDGCITQGGIRDLNLLTALMNTVQRKSKFLTWCFGSYHINRIVPPNYRCLYSDLYCAGGQDNSFVGRLKKHRNSKTATV